MENFILNKTLLTSTEKENILFALMMLQSIPDISTESALNKIASLFKTTAHTEQWLEINFSRWGNDNIFDDELFQTLKNCIIQRKQLIIKYANANGEFTERIIEPFKLIFRFRDWYLHAFCLTKMITDYLN